MEKMNVYRFRIKRSQNRFRFYAARNEHHAKLMAGTEDETEVEPSFYKHLYMEDVDLPAGLLTRRGFKNLVGLSMISFDGVNVESNMFSHVFLLGLG